MEHFGIKLLNKGKSFRLIKEEFAIIDTKPSFNFSHGLAKKNAYIDEKGSAYREEWCEAYRELCLKNFDLNMEYFSMLDKAEFENALTAFLKRYHGFEEVKDMNKYSEIEGYYIMVLDDYRQVYIGKTDNIKKRIMQHWTKNKPFDRTLFPMYEYQKSCFSIDFFRALDTTRIYAWKRDLSDFLEAELIDEFPQQFCTNRIGGDITSAIHAMGTMKRREC